MPAISKRNVGIFATPYGFRAFVSVNGKLHTKRFPPLTPNAEMRQWRDDTKRQQRSARIDLPEVPRPTWNAPPRQCYLYAIRSGDAVKFGHARNVHLRIDRLQTSHHETLQLVGCMLGTVEDEGQIHNRFRRAWIRGEWFRLEPDVVAFIRSMPSVIPVSENDAQCSPPLA